MEEKFLGRRTKVLAKNRQKCGYCDGHHKANVSRWGGEMSHAWNKLFTIIQDPLLDRVSCCTRLSLQTVLKDAFTLNNSTTTHGIDCLRGLSGTVWRRTLDMLKAPSEVIIPRKSTTGRDVNRISFGICRKVALTKGRQVGSSLISARKEGDVGNAFQLRQTKVTNNKTRKQ